MVEINRSRERVPGRIDVDESVGRGEQTAGDVRRAGEEGEGAGGEVGDRGD